MTKGIEHLWTEGTAPQDVPALLVAIWDHIDNKVGKENKQALEACFQSCKQKAPRRGARKGPLSPVSQCLAELLLVQPSSNKDRSRLPYDQIIRDIFKSVIGRWLFLKSNDSGELDDEYSSDNVNAALKPHGKRLFPESDASKVRKTGKRSRDDQSTKPESSMASSDTTAGFSIATNHRDSVAQTKETADTAPVSLEPSLDQPDATSGLLESDASASKRLKRV